MLLYCPSSLIIFLISSPQISFVFFLNMLELHVYVAVFYYIFYWLVLFTGFVDTLIFFFNPLLGFICKTLHDTNRPLHSALHVFLHKPPTNTQSTAAMQVFQSAPPLRTCTHTHTQTALPFFVFDQPCSALLFSVLGAQTSNLG